MAIRKEVEDFVKLGPLPDDAATDEQLVAATNALKRIPEPVTDEEAARLEECFGLDDCFGLAQSLVGLIETAPGARDRDLKPKPSPTANRWIRDLWDTAARTRQWEKDGVLPARHSDPGRAA